MVKYTFVFKGQIQLNGNVNISQTDIPFHDGLYYHIESVLAPPEMGGILPHRCDLKTSRVVRVSVTFDSSHHTL